MLGEQIKKARKNLKWSLRDLAERSGVSFSTIGRIESGHNADYENVVAVLKALDLYDQLLIKTDSILEKQLIKAWRERDFSLILEMVSREVKDSKS